MEVISRVSKIDLESEEKKYNTDGPNSVNMSGTKWQRLNF